MQCPGQDSRYWKPGAIFESKCPECGGEIEFFKDEPSRRCKNCGHRVLNPKIDFGCATYCKYAEQCLGELSPELLAKRDDLLKDRVAIAMKRYFGQDFRRINHARRVARYAEEIGKNEQANMAVILCAAYLHDIGIKEAERKHQNTAARYHEQEGPPVARQILEQLGARPELIDEVCDIVRHHHQPRPQEATNFKALYDADLIVNLEEQQEKAPLDRDRLAAKIDKAFLTDSGQALARRVLLKLL